MSDPTAGGEDQPSLLQRVVPAVAAAATAPIFGPLEGIAGATLAVVFEPLFARVFAELSADGRARMYRVLATGAEVAGVSAEEFAERACADDRARLLAGQAFTAASRTTYSPKIRALGRALAAGLLAQDDSRIDDEQLVLAALADMEAPHAALLELLVHFTPGHPIGTIAAADGSLRQEFSDPAPYAPPQNPGTPEQRRGSGPRSWSSQAITEARPQLNPVLTGLLGTLERHGLISRTIGLSRVLNRYTRGVVGGHGMRADDARPSIAWEPTPLGERVDGYLRMAAADR